MRVHYTYILSVLLIILLGCNTSVHNIREYNAWLNNPGNGCITNKSIGGIDIAIKYLPRLYSVIKKSNYAATAVNNINEDEKILTFLMTIAIEKDNLGSVSTKGIRNYTEYEERMKQMNFGMEKYISLYVDGVKHKSAIAIVENAYEASNSRNFTVIFTSLNNTSMLNGNEYVFVYDDPFFNIGKVQLSLYGKDLLKSEKIKIEM